MIEEAYHWLMSRVQASSDKNVWISFDSRLHGFDHMANIEFSAAIIGAGCHSSAKGASPQDAAEKVLHKWLRGEGEEA